MKKKSCRSNTSAFTLVELLVVIAIIGVLVSLLLPAVQAAREAARRTQCQNNFKQVGLALITFHDVNGAFPPAASYDDQTARNPAYARVHQANWIIQVLPQMEQATLYDSFDLTIPISGDESTSPANYQARGTSIPALLCPSDSYNRESMFKGRSSSEGGNWARGNIGANGALGFMGISTNPAGNKDQIYWKDERTRGIMGVNTSISMREITDGTSNTILAGELRAGVVSADSRGTWALNGHGASSLWGHGSDNANGPNSCLPGGDGLFECGSIEGAFGGKDALVSECMPCDTIAGQGGPRSLHIGGAFFTFVDGSVHFISDFIDKGNQITNWELDPETYRTWQRLCASGDGQVIGETDF